MKKLFFFIFIILVLTSCDKNKINRPEGKLIDYTDCKYNKDAVMISNESCIEYRYDADSETLSLKHINTAFNCCPGELYFDVQFSGDTISIEEFEKKQECNCLCLYDMEMELYDIEAQSFTLKFVELYVYDEEELIFQIDLRELTSGTHCVERNNYPWGI